MDTDLFFKRSAPSREPSPLNELRPEPYPNGPELYSACWSILVLFGGAYDGDRARETFVRTFLATMYPATEYRFGGMFGFGGKFWRNDGRLYISYYPEDQTKTLDAVRDTINEVLAQLTPKEGVWGPPKKEEARDQAPRT